MEASQVYVIIAIVSLLLIGILLFFISKKKPKPTPLTGIAFAFVIAGILFGDSRWIGYSLMGTGVLLAIIDMIIKLKKRGKKK